MSHVVEPSLVEQGKAALGRHEWREAYDLMSAGDGRGEVTGADLELYAQASWWIGRLPEAIEIRERAFAAAVTSGDDRGAVLEAISLARDNTFRMNESLSTAWLNRAARFLEGAPESPATGWLAAIAAMGIGQSNRLDEALDKATLGYEIGRRTGDRDLETFALSCRGLMLVYLGRIDEGLAALDEATVVAMAGELAPDVAGGVCCTAIGTCAILGDWSRATAWTEAQDRWCRREHINGFPGMCRLYRAEAKRVHGDWLEAEAEARRATDELAGFIPAAVGLAHYEVGVLRLRRGDLPAAEDALIRAHAFNRDPEPARSLLRLAQGRVEDATESIRRALDEPPTTMSWTAPPASRIYRTSLLPAQVEIALAAGDVGLARRAADALAALAEEFPTPTVTASTAAAIGAVFVAEGDVAGGQASLRRAVDLWSQIDAPYEVSRARLALGRAYLADGAVDRAALEIGAALAGFERLGAALDARAAEGALAALSEGSPTRARPAERRADRTFVFTDIVDSTKFAELLGDSAWHDLLRWHDQTIRAIAAEHGGEDVKTVGDGFFLAFETVDEAIQAAVAIQRRFAEQRRDHGFAPAVRIGLHRADADRAGLDYIGTGVNAAARVAGQAGGGEILMSSTSVAAARNPPALGEPRVVALKGIAEPMELVPILWQ